VKATSDEIEFMLTSKDDYLHLYPFRFDLSCSYRLEKNTLHIIYKVSNRDEKIMLFSIGAHPGFVVPLKEDAKRSDYYLLFENEEFTHTRRLDQNGLISSEEELVLDHTDRLDITDDLFNNDALIFEDLKSDFLYLVNREGKKIWKFDFTGFPFLGIWSKSEHSPFVCIEPWHGIADLTKSDGLLSNKTGIRSLTANQSFECKHSITIY
jgi:galactose mutarotase-like enzyme